MSSREEAGGIQLQNAKGNGNGFIIPAAVAVAIVGGAYVLGKDQGASEEQFERLNQAVQSLQTEVKRLRACVYYDVNCEPPTAKKGAPLRATVPQRLLDDEST